MSKLSWALAALALTACSGDPSSDGGPDKGHGTDKGITEPDPTEMITLNYTVFADGVEQAVDINVDGEKVGNTSDPEPPMIEPGAGVVTLGDVSFTTLGKVPVHSTSNDKRYVWTPEAIDSLQAGDTLTREINLEPSKPYVCSSRPCEPYQGYDTEPESCNGTTTNDDPQGIYVRWNAGVGTLEGDQNNNFGSSGSDDDVWTLENGVLTYVSGNPQNDITNVVFHENDLSFEYMVTNTSFEVVVTVSCRLRN